MWALSMQKQLSEYTRVWSKFLKDADGSEVERLVRDQLRITADQQDSMRLVEERVKILEAKTQHSKRFVGVVRYNAFDAVGGDQSFSVAMYDDDGNGVVITSQVGRETCRVYGKQLVLGRCEQTLSAEEQQAIEQAAHTRGRARIGT